MAQCSRVGSFLKPILSILFLQRAWWHSLLVFSCICLFWSVFSPNGKPVRDPLYGLDFCKLNLIFADPALDILFWYIPLKRSCCGNLRFRSKRKKLLNSNFVISSQSERSIDGRLFNLQHQGRFSDQIFDLKEDSFRLCCGWGRLRWLNQVSRNTAFLFSPFRPKWQVGILKR